MGDGLQFNVKKCKVMHLGFNNPGQVYTMRGQALEETDEERDIGVEMSKSLKPSAQCAKAARTAQTVSPRWQGPSITGTGTYS
jgi:hypothetical protein